MVSINFYDRYLSSRTTKVNARQNKLLVLVCLYIAGRLLEELSEPTAKEIIAVSEFECTLEEIKVIILKLIFREWKKRFLPL